jgi:hypothetical protein
MVALEASGQAVEALSLALREPQRLVLLGL